MITSDRHGIQVRDLLLEGVQAAAVLAIALHRQF